MVLVEALDLPQAVGLELEVEGAGGREALALRDGELLLGDVEQRVGALDSGQQLGQPERAAFWEARSCRCVPLA